MLANAELAQDYSILNRQYQQLVDALLQSVGLQGIPGLAEQEITVFYGSEGGATLHSYPALDFMSRVFTEREATKLWTRLLVTYSGIMLRITAARTRDDTTATPGYEDYEPGDVIIQQGERADYVFNPAGWLKYWWMKSL